MIQSSSVCEECYVLAAIIILNLYPVVFYDHLSLFHMSFSTFWEQVFLFHALQILTTELGYGRSSVNTTEYKDKCSRVLWHYMCAFTQPLSIWLSVIMPPTGLATHPSTWHVILPTCSGSLGLFQGNFSIDQMENRNVQIEISKMEMTYLEKTTWKVLWAL